MNAQEISNIAQEAKVILDSSDRVVRDIAPLLRGRLKACCWHDLAELKKELRGFNIHLNSWSDK